MYHVYENNKPASKHGFPRLNDWENHTFATFEEAQKYTRKWLGQYSGNCPTRPNKTINYNGHGDIIEIRHIGDDEELAIFLHDKFCSYNHTDGCAWHYEIKDKKHGYWDAKNSAHKRWLKYAKEVKKKFGEIFG